MRLLLCTDGSPYAERAAQFGALIARAASAEVVLLGIAESRRSEAGVSAALARLRELIDGTLTVTSIKRRTGQAAEQILADSASAAYDLIVIGSRGRRGLRRLVLGSTAATLAKYSRVPLLIVKGARMRLRRILVCTGGEVVAEASARLGGLIAGASGSAVTLLHVMSQIPIAAKADLLELGGTAEEAIAAGTREGQHLERGLNLLRQAGAAGDVQPKIRRGFVVDEILDEADSGDYDLIVIGAHQAPPQAAWRGLREMLLDDVADRVVSQCQRPVMVVR